MVADYLALTWVQEEAINSSSFADLRGFVAKICGIAVIGREDFIQNLVHLFYLR